MVLYTVENVFSFNRLLVVTAFKTQEMANLQTSLRFENISHATTFPGTRFPGIRIERLDKRNSGDRGKSVGSSTSARKRTKHAVSAYSYSTSLSVCVFACCIKEFVKIHLGL